MTTKTPELPRLLNQRQLAEYLGKSTAWCERARWAGNGPPYRKIGRHVRYVRDEVDAWVDAQRRTCTTDTDAAARGTR